VGGFPSALTCMTEGDTLTLEFSGDVKGENVGSGQVCTSCPNLMLFIYSVTPFIYNVNDRNFILVLCK